MNQSFAYLFRSVSRLCRKIACSAYAFPAIPVKVPALIWMTRFTVSLVPLEARPYGGYQGWGKPSQAIHSGCDRFQVSRIDAAPNAAQVVNLQSCWYWPRGHFIHDSVCICGFTHADLKSSVPASGYCAQPKPASGVGFWGNVAHEALKNWYLRCSHVILLRSHRLGLHDATNIGAARLNCSAEVPA